MKAPKFPLMPTQEEMKDLKPMSKTARAKARTHVRRYFKEHPEEVEQAGVVGPKAFAWMVERCVDQMDEVQAYKRWREEKLRAMAKAGTR